MHPGPADRAGGSTLTGPHSHDWADELAQLPDHLRAKVSAPGDPGTYTLVLHPSNLWLTIHESVGHATELDRIRGYEANYAGSVVRRRQRGGDSAIRVARYERARRPRSNRTGWPRSGGTTKVAAQDWALIDDGVLVGVQIGPGHGLRTVGQRSNGCAYADSARHVPLQRMPNVSLQPDPDGGSLDDLIAGVDDGILGGGRRLLVHRHAAVQLPVHRPTVRADPVGTARRPLQDVAYQGSTPGFWGRWRRWVARRRMCWAVR